VYHEVPTVSRAVMTDFLTVGVWRSLWITIFGMYQGVWIVMCKTLAWKRSTCTGVWCAILCQMLEICLRMLQNNIAYFHRFNLSFVEFDVFVLLWSASL
jgi:hypothetical protein